jgi:hypothetical protein
MSTLSDGEPLSRNGITNSLLTTAEAAHYLGISVVHLCKIRVTVSGPHFVKLSRAVRYRLRDLDSWIDARRYTSTFHEQFATET